MLRFSWLLTMEDTVTPFIIGLLEFAMIDLMGPQTMGPWFLALATVFAVSIGASHLIMRRARRDPANDHFFSQVGRARWRDYALSSVVVAFLALFGIALWLLAPSAKLTLVALLFAVAALVYQLFIIHRYWLPIPDTAA